MKILIINGPNLNLLGKREMQIYGATSFEEYLPVLKRSFPELNIEYVQSNLEGEIINALQNAEKDYDGVILNAAGYTHTSVAIADAIRAIPTPVIEVHITNIFAREEYRHISLVGPNAVGSIIGFGLCSYDLALESFRKNLKDSDR